MKKYETLINVLDAICKEAPAEDGRYKINRFLLRNDNPSIEKVNQARARAYIHLYLKVKFGIASFQEREHLVTDAGNDGGIDAYYIDKENKTVHVIQSKFRTNETNFSEKPIDLKELAKMDVARVVTGEPQNEEGCDYNEQIKQFQQALQSTQYLSQYKYKIVILANCNIIHFEVFERLYPDYQVEVFDYQRAYKELLFPVVSGTYFKADDINIKISLDNTSVAHSRVNYSTIVDGVDVDVMVLFAPTLEIGRIVYLYRNSLLEFNPRSFLGLSTGTVNEEIRSAIVGAKDNKFSLYNNGITIVADGAGYTEKTGRRNVATLDIKNPQIINGGQTAYTLCSIYEKLAPDGDFVVFDNKEVMLKIITIDPNVADKGKIKNIIDSISRSSNLQTKVDEADRRSNDPLQLKIQEIFYERYGLFYERKSGEFHDGIEAGYINQSVLVNREELMRIALATSFKVSATRASVQNYFSYEAFDQGILDKEKIDVYAKGYAVFQEINKIQSDIKDANKDDAFCSLKYGNALRYGKYAVTCVATNLALVPNSEVTEISEVVNLVLNKWLEFEAYIVSSKNKYIKGGSLDAVSFYKGDTINADLENYFFKEASSTVGLRQLELEL